MYIYLLLQYNLFKLRYCKEVNYEKNHKNTKKFIVLLTLIFVITASGVSSFADSETSLHHPKRVERLVFEITDDKDLQFKEVSSLKTEYLFHSDGIEFQIPKKANSEIVIKNKGVSLSNELPLELDLKDGVKTTNGTVVYSGANGADIAIQALTNSVNDSDLSCIRTMIVINNANAPSKYSFKYNLPRGYYLTTSEQYYANNTASIEQGYVYIVAPDGTIENVIEPAWAMAADGNAVDSTYSIDGDTLIQSVDFNEDNKFPIVADPTSHPTKYSDFYLTKAGVKKIRDQYTKADTRTLYEGLLACCCFKSNPLGATFSSLIFINVTYSAIKYKTWDKILKEFEKKYAKVRIKYVWRSGGKNSAYIPAGQKVTYVNKKGA